MSEQIGFENGNHRLTPELELEWQNAFKEALQSTGDALSGTGELLSRFAHIRLTEGDDQYSILPTLKWIDGEVEITCNLDAYDQWNDVFSQVEGTNDEQTRKLYLGTAASWVELSFLAFSAKEERKLLSEDSRRGEAIKRAGSIARKLATRDDLKKSAEVLETDHDIYGAVDAIDAGLSDLDVLAVNRLRYGLGAAYFALGYSKEAVSSIVESVRNVLKTELTNYEDSMIMFLTAFAEVDPYVDFADSFQKLKRDSFPALLFALTIPMGYKES